MCLIALLLVMGALVLTGCSSPSDNTLCTGADAANCVVNKGAIVNPTQGGEWYLQWFYNGINAMLGFICNQSVGIGISLFWKIFRSQATLDFTQAGDNRILAANAVEAIVAGCAYALIPAVLMWQIFRHYGINTLLEAARDGIFSIGLKVLGAALCILNLPMLMTFAFGLSNALFIAIIGDTARLHDLAEATLTSINAATLAVHDPGLLVIMVILCVVLGLIWLLLGIVFLVRSVLVFILYALAPLAFLAAATDDFKAWFEAWFEEVMNLIIAPIPVAICIRLVVAFADVNQLKNVNAANLDTFGDSLVQLVYILFFMVIGVVLMGKIGGKVSGAMFRMAAYAFKQAVRSGMRYATGGASAGLEGAMAGAGASATASVVIDKQFMQSLAASMNGGESGAATGGSATPSGESAGGAPAGNGWPSGGGNGGSSGGGGAQGGGDVTRGLRSVNETMQDFAYSASARSGSYSSGGRGGSGMAVAEAEIGISSAPPARYSGGNWQSAEPTPAMRESTPPATEYVPRQSDPAEHISPAPSAPSRSQSDAAEQPYVTGAVADPFGSRSAPRATNRKDETHAT